MNFRIFNCGKKIKYMFGDLEVFSYRVWKLGRLQILRITNYWPRLHRRLKSFWDSNGVDLWIELAKSNKLLIGSKNIQAFRDWVKEYPDKVDEILLWARQIDGGKFKIFDHEYQFDWKDIPWLTDWRWPFTWDKVYFRDYKHYACNKKVPHDVKFPWEISRLSFFIPLAQAAIITGDAHWRDKIVEGIIDWERKNPVVYSVNWCAMECAIRGIVLALVVQMLASGTSIQREQLSSLLRQLTLQGEVLFRNIEYTKVRSNHYTANLVGLLMMGHTLCEIYRPASKWINYAEKRVFAEILSQFLEDGVNFEKSISYHRFVTELFLLALLQIEHCGGQISEKIRDRLHRACEYSRWYTRPDGLVPNWGDNDSARLLGFDNSPLRSHQTILDLAASFYPDRSLRCPEEHFFSSIVPLLMGETGMRRMKMVGDNDVHLNGARYFGEGGIFISRYSNNFFFADFGEVGTSGTGGHGHNDTFSFELFLGGEPVIIDPGSPVYTGNLFVYDRYRSTESHNTVRIDGQEMARLTKTWVINNEAAPLWVKCEFNAEVDSIEGEHNGYGRLTDPLTHKRKFMFYRREGRLICQESFKCKGGHLVEQFFYLARGIKVEQCDNNFFIHLASGETIAMISPLGAKCRVEKARISENFGHEADSEKIMMEYEIHGNTTVGIEIKMC